MCHLVSCSPPSQTGTGNWGSLSSQFWGQARLNTTSYTQSLLTHYQRAKHLEGLFQYNHRAPQGSLCQKSNSHVVCRLQKYIPKYTPFQKPTLSKVSVPPTYLLSQLFILNTCLGKTERTQKSPVREQRSVFLSWRNCPSAQMWKATVSIEERKLLQLWDCTDTSSLTAWVLTPLVLMGPQEEILGNTPWHKTAAMLSMAQLWCRATEGLFTEESLLKCIIPLPQAPNFIISIVNTRTRGRNRWVHTRILQSKK